MRLGQKKVLDTLKAIERADFAVWDSVTLFTADQQSHELSRLKIDGQVVHGVSTTTPTRLIILALDDIVGLAMQPHDQPSDALTIDEYLKSKIVRDRIAA